MTRLQWPSRLTDIGLSSAVMGTAEGTVAFQLNQQSVTDKETTCLKVLSSYYM